MKKHTENFTISLAIFVLLSLINPHYWIEYGLGTIFYWLVKLSFEEVKPELKKLNLPKLNKPIRLLLNIVSLVLLLATICISSHLSLITFVIGICIITYLSLTETKLPEQNEKD